MSAAIERREGLTILPFAPSELGIYAKPLNADGSVAPQRAAEALAMSGARAVLDGPMFHLCSDQPAAPSQAERYARASCAKLDYLHYDLARGLNFLGSPSTSGRGGILLVTEAGHAEFVAASERPNVPRTRDLRVAIQLYPVMVVGGRAAPQSTSGSNGNAEWRAAVGILADGRLAFAIGAYSMPDFADRLARAGFRFAGYTDGGGSTRIELDDGQRFGASENRPVASWLTVGAPRGLGGGALIVGGLALALAWYVARRR